MANTILPKTNIQDDIEKIANSFKLLRETTEQVATEANMTASFLKDQLQETTFRFFSIIDSINDIIMIKDDKNRWRTVNKFGQELFNLTPKQYLGKTDIELAKEFSNHEIALLHCSKTDELAWKTKTFYREIETLHINNNYLYFDVIKTPIFHDNGERKELIVIARDITELRNSELKTKAFTNALNGASDNIIMFDSLGKIIFTNEHITHEFKNISHGNNQYFNSIFHSSFNVNIITGIWERIQKNLSWQGCAKLNSDNNKLVEGYLNIIPVMNGLPVPAYFICILKTKNYCKYQHDMASKCCDKPLNCSFFDEI